jgi:hypothetical protein
MADKARGKSTIRSRWRQRRWQKASRRREIQERRAGVESPNRTRLRVESAEEPRVDLGGGWDS